MTQEDKKLLHDIARKLGFAEPYELLFVVPKRFLDYRLVNKKSVFEERVALKQHAALQVEALSAISAHAQKNMNTFRAHVLGVDQTVRVVKWGKAFGAWSKIVSGSVFSLFGKLDMFAGQVYFNATEIIALERINKIIPVYPGFRKKIAKDKIFRAIQAAAKNPAFLDMAAQRVFNETGGAMPVETVRNILCDMHMPSSMEDGYMALQAIRCVAVNIVAKRLEALRCEEPQSALEIAYDTIRETIASIPFEPTESQRQAINSVYVDLIDTYPARHLVSGDVGSGKSITYLVPAVAAVKSGYRAAVVVPNLLLANQVAHEAQTYWPDVPIKVVTGATKNEVARNDNAMIIGTSAVLFRAAKSGYYPHVLVLDEQQKMSKKQRDALVAPYTNVIEATATCLPRTAALIKLGAWRASRIYPHAKKDIVTELYFEEDRKALFDSLKKIVARGGRIAAVYPLVVEDCDGDFETLQSQKYTAEAAYSMWNKVFPDDVVLLHGKMSDEEKVEALQQAKDSKHVIVTTTVLEIGITILGLEAMVVIEPYRYGLSTLHQLRGRLVRHGGKGLFAMYFPFNRPQDVDLDENFVFGDNDDEEDRSLEEKRLKFVKRLEVLKNENDGHKIAEIDLRIRGFGDLTQDSDAQSGASKSTIFYGIKFTSDDFKGVLQ